MATKRLVWTGPNRQAAQLQGWDIFEHDDPHMFLINGLDEPQWVAEEYYGQAFKGIDFSNDHGEKKLTAFLRRKLKAGDPLVTKAVEILKRKKSPQVERLVRRTRGVPS